MVKLFSNRKDSVVTEKINFDLLKKAKLIQEGLQPCNELLGCFIKKWDIYYKRLD